VFDFGPSAQAAAQLAELVLQHGQPERTLLNVNVPKGMPRGIKRTVQGKRKHITKISERTDPRGKPYYWIDAGIDDWFAPDLSAYHACKERFISVSLLSPDMTAYSSMEQLERFPMPEGFAAGSEVPR
jgi:5'-nucleotidase